MFKKYPKLISSLLAVWWLSACATSSMDSNQADRVLRAFFEQLTQGEYEAAAALYAGSYETLVTFNPDIDPEDHAALWRSGCQVNGLQCLTVRSATFNEVTDTGEYVFTVEFNAPDGSLFTLGACCGENPSSPPQFQFEYRVVEGDNGQFRVLDMPVYVP